LLNDSFTCPRNIDVETFLKNKAIRFEKTGTSRTYLILNNENGEILGYFSLSFKSLALDTSKISATQVKRLDGISKHAKNIKVFLIGQIGKNSQIENNPLSLKIILSEIYGVIAQVQSLIGGRVIVLECEDHPRLINLYESHGYKVIDITEQESLKTLYIAISEVK